MHVHGAGGKGLPGKGMVGRGHGLRPHVLQHRRRRRAQGSAVGASHQPWTFSVTRRQEPETPETGKQRQLARHGSSPAAVGPGAVGVGTGGNGFLGEVGRGIVDRRSLTEATGPQESRHQQSTDDAAPVPQARARFHGLLLTVALRFRCLGLPSARNAPGSLRGPWTFPGREKFPPRQPFLPMPGAAAVSAVFFRRQGGPPTC